MKITTIPSQDEPAPKKRIFDVMKTEGISPESSKPVGAKRIPIDKQKRIPVTTYLSVAEYKAFRDTCLENEEKLAAVMRRMIRQYVRKNQANDI